MNKYVFTKQELSTLENFTEKDNMEMYNMLINMREHMRRTKISSSIDYLTLDTMYMLPVNLLLIIDNARNTSEPINKDIIKNPKYILEQIEYILETKNTRLYNMPSNDLSNKKSVKYIDEHISKSAFRYALYDALNPKKCIMMYKFTKKQIDDIVTKIIKNFNKSVIESGEMVGILAAQSIGEPVTQLTLNSFHSAGIGGGGGVNMGIPRIKEVFSLSKNMKEPMMTIYLDKQYHKNKKYANKIASYIKYTTIKDIRKKIEIFYDSNPYKKGGFMDQDNVYNIFYSYQQNKNCCDNTIDGLSWLMRIEFDKEKLLAKEVSLLDIKSQFCQAWEKRYTDIKSLKREKKVILDKITHIAVLSNNDNDEVPVMHIRFDMNNFNSSNLVDFTDLFVDEFKLKGITDIQDIRNLIDERYIDFNDETGAMDITNEYVIYTKGINMYDIRKLIGIDINRTYCNDIIQTYEIFGIEAARTIIIHQITSVLASNGLNFQHISIFGDIMTNVGTLTSIDRHGLNKLDTDPLSRASFEKTVEQLISAAVFNETDYMKSVSSRIIAGLCIKGGTGLCNLILDRELLENSEYTTDIGQLYKKTYNDISIKGSADVDTDVFIPSF